jgi:isopenicillin-N epimerase
MAPDLSRFWSLDPSVTFLNHGSFGACPRAVLAKQAELRDEMERQPVRFLWHGFEPRLDAARSALAAFLGADPEDLVFVDNATSGLNAVLRSLRFAPGDELVVTDQEYNASRNILEFVAARAGAKVVVAHLPFPIDAPGRVESAVLERVTSRTRLVLIDHVTSQTGLILPVGRLAPELAARGIDLLVDGAHGPGMVPLELRRLGVPFYTGNCHKWLCAPKGAAFLWVRRDRQAEIRPAVISHGANSPRTDRSRYLLEFGWTGTDDPTAWLCVPEAIRFLGSLLPGGWPELMALNRALALAARDLLCQALGIDPPAPDEMIGTLVALPLPDLKGAPPAAPLYRDPLEERLESRYGIVLPVMAWPDYPKRLLRVAAQAYNSLPQYEKLAAALRELLPQA